MSVLFKLALLMIDKNANTGRGGLGTKSYRENAIVSAQPFTFLPLTCLLSHSFSAHMNQNVLISRFKSEDSDRPNENSQVTNDQSVPEHWRRIDDQN